MLSRSLSDYQSLTLNFVIQVSLSGMVRGHFAPRTKCPKTKCPMDILPQDILPQIAQTFWRWTYCPNCRIMVDILPQDILPHFWATFEKLLRDSWGIFERLLSDFSQLCLVQYYQLPNVWYFHFSESSEFLLFCSTFQHFAYIFHYFLVFFSWSDGMIYTPLDVVHY